jgi:membrane-associated phospholipid phosphatase
MRIGFGKEKVMDCMLPYRSALTALSLSTGALAVFSHLLLYGFSLGVQRWEWYSYWLPYFGLMFLVAWAAVGLVESLLVGKEFIDERSGQLRLRELYSKRVFHPNPVSGIIVVFVMTAGIVSTSGITEYYVQNTTRWFDEQLWSIDRVVVEPLLSSKVNIPWLWDVVYFSIWPLLYVSLAVLYRGSFRVHFEEIALAVVVAFYVSRFANIFYATAGPAFFRPNVFGLVGTTSESVQYLLLQYMSGVSRQNGLLPGTMAMPSLHVCLVAIATSYLGKWRKKSLWVTTPWLILTWLSTVMLGWHYILDGVIGGALAVFAIGVARIVVVRFKAKSAADSFYRST